MEVTPTIWDSKLDAFCERVANGDPTSTGVSVAAVSAALGASLLEMVLEIIARRTMFPGSAEKLASLRRAVKNESERLMLCVDTDIAAYGAYMEALRSKADPAEIARCQHRTVEVPLQAARAAIAALDLCGQARNIVSGAITADLSTAAILLESAVRAILRCVEENLRAVPDPRAAAECTAFGEEASRMLRLVLTAGVEE